jgi:two-component system, cell cycle response regulator DivK
MGAKRRRRKAQTRVGRPAEAPLVLLVDDVADNRTVYAMWLTAVGFRIVEAANGQEALEAVVRLRPDVVVMDLSLPQMDGWEATRRIKAAPETRALPVIALTGYALADHAQRAREAGCDLVITKPCLPEDLEKILRGTLEGTPARPRRR